ncbi:Uncharacterized protein OBRU01_02765, partial [Operophtera brumata]
MEIDYKILNLYKTKQYDECLKLCAVALHEKDDRMVEFIRMRAMSIQAKLAGNGYEEVEYFPQQDSLTSTAVAKTPRPGTSFQRQVTTALSSGEKFNPGVPLSLRFLSKEDKLFNPAAKTLFEYVYYCEGDVRKAMEVAFQAQKVVDTTDWWWNFSLARCYYALGMVRNTEECLRQALKQHKHISIYLRLVAMYVGLNQPLSALEVCKQGLTVFHEYTPLLLEQARIHDQMGNSALAVKEYRMVALEDPSNVEAIANIALFNFYNDQPEIALLLPCFRQALYFSTDPETRANIWFNLAHVAL